MEIQFISGVPGADGRYPENLYYDPEQVDGRPALINTPGLKQVAKPQSNVAVRALFVHSGLLYAVCGDKFYSIDSNWDVTQIAGVGTSSGKCWIEFAATTNGDYLFVCDGESGYLYEPSTGTWTTLDIYPASSVASLNGYFLYSRKNTGQFYLVEGTSPDASEMAEAEGSGDNIVTLISANRLIWILGEETMEIWWNSDNVDFPFDYQSGTFQHVGCAAAGSAVVLDNGVFWLDNERRVCRSMGYTPTVISTPQVNKQFAQYERVSDAIAYAYTEMGHSFYVLTFPHEKKTWVYDAATNLWHIRSSGLSGERHRSNCYAYFNEKHIVGDYENGRIYEMSYDYHDDDGELIRCRRIAPPIYDNVSRRKIFFDQIELEFKSGMGRVHEQGRTTLSADASQGDASITVSDATNIKQDYDIGVVLDDGSTQWTRVTLPPAGNTVYLAETLNGAASTGNRVEFYDGIGKEPKAMLRWTDNDGRTWSNEHWKEIGQAGEYEKRVVWYRLGHARQRAFEVTITDPVERVIKSAYIRGKVGVT